MVKVCLMATFLVSSSLLLGPLRGESSAMLDTMSAQGNELIGSGAASAILEQYR
jgi:hypothetical protein